MRGKAQHSRFLLIEAVEPRGLHHHAELSRQRARIPRIKNRHGGQTRRNLIGKQNARSATCTPRVERTAFRFPLKRENPPNWFH